MIFLAWNCRGAGNPRFKSVLRDMIGSYNPDVIVILEPRISGANADKVCKSFPNFSFSRIEATRFVGGIWVLWQPNRITIMEVSRHPHAFHFKITKGAFSGLFTAVYGNPQRSTRMELWNFLESISLHSPHHGS